MTEAVLFDLGNTLVAYYRRDEFRPVLEDALARVLRRAQFLGLKTPGYDGALQRALGENREAADCRVTPIAERFERILGVTCPDDIAEALSEAFLEPMFEGSRRYDDGAPTLAALRAAGLKTAIVSNTLWGSPPHLWRRELARLGIRESVDAAVWCGDVGWRKPARKIFHRAAEELGVSCQGCVFVGDEPLSDMLGAAAVGMQPVLLDREHEHGAHDGVRINSLDQLPALLGLGGRGASR